MQTNKEALLALLKGEKADFIPEVYPIMKDVVFPGDRYIELCLLYTSPSPRDRG